MIGQSFDMIDKDDGRTPRAVPSDEMRQRLRQYLESKKAGTKTIGSSNKAKVVKIGRKIPTSAGAQTKSKLASKVLNRTERMETCKSLLEVAEEFRAGDVIEPICKIGEPKVLPIAKNKNDSLQLYSSSSFDRATLNTIRRHVLYDWVRNDPNFAPKVHHKVSHLSFLTQEQVVMHRLAIDQLANGLYPMVMDLEQRSIKLRHQYDQIVLKKTPFIDEMSIDLSVQGLDMMEEQVAGLIGLTNQLSEFADLKQLIQTALKNVRFLFLVTKTQNNALLLGVV